MSKRVKKVVCLGGGTGTSIVLSGLKKYPIDLTVIVTMFDSGGSSGRLRKEIGILPLGDIRQGLTSTASYVPYLDYFNLRDGGENMGNYLIAEEERKTGSLERAINKWRNKLRTKAKIFPVTLKEADIVAILKDNRRVEKEERIINYSAISKIGVKRLVLEPRVKANPKAISAIKKADLIIIGPGKFYTSIIPIFLVEGITEAIRKSRAKKIFICNLMTQVGNTDNFSVEDFLRILEKYLNKDIIDYVIVNTGKLPSKLIKEVKKVFPKAEFIKYDKNLFKNKKFIGADVLDKKIRKLNPRDILVKKANQRTMVLHNSDKLAKIILKLCRQ